VAARGVQPPLRLDARRRELKRTAFHHGGRSFELVQDRGDVDAAVFGGVGRESAGRLRELSLAADAVPAPGLVPGDGDVDEALEEVALCGLSGAPNVLELLVRREELAAADQLEPMLKLRLRSSRPRP
jgi:hypothetical protein